jgi:hypothetical protein
MIWVFCQFVFVLHCTFERAHVASKRTTSGMSLHALMRIANGIVLGLKGLMVIDEEMAVLGSM